MRQRGLEVSQCSLQYLALSVLVCRSSGQMMRTVSSPAMVPTTSRPVFIVYRCGDRLGRAGGGDEDEQIGGLAGLEAEAAQDLANAGAFVIGGVDVGRKGVAVGPFGEIEFVDIAGERGLGDVEATGGEATAQLILIGDGAGQEGSSRIAVCRCCFIAVFASKVKCRLILDRQDCVVPYCSPFCCCSCPPACCNRSNGAQSDVLYKNTLSCINIHEQLGIAGTASLGPHHCTGVARGLARGRCPGSTLGCMVRRSLSVRWCCI